LISALPTLPLTSDSRALPSPPEPLRSALITIHRFTTDSRNSQSISSHSSVTCCSPGSSGLRRGKDNGQFSNVIGTTLDYGCTNMEPPYLGLDDFNGYCSLLRWYTPLSGKESMHMTILQIEAFSYS
jgi:hypothetical protein